MRQLSVLIAALVVQPTLAIHPALGAPAAAVEDGAPLQVGVQRVVQSAILGEPRTLLVQLPAGYAEGSKRYPTLYRLDGDAALFLDAVTAERFLSEFAERIPAHIIVGVTNTDRARDVSTARGSERFLRFIEDELIPFIDRSYRTSGERVLCGQSASANFAAEVLTRRPRLFAAYVLGSLGPGSAQSQALIERLRGGWSPSSDLSVFVTAGRRDSYDASGERTRNAEAFLAELRRVGGDSVRCELRVYEDEGHVPGPGLYDGLKWIYARCPR